MLAASFMVASAAAAGATGPWIRIAEGPQALVVFYAKTASAKGERRSVQLLYDYSAPQEDPDSLVSHQSAVVTATVDCGKSRLRMGDMIKYKGSMGQGETVERTHSSDRSFHQAARDSINWKIVRFACDQSR